MSLVSQWLIHNCGLPFSLADEPKLARVIKLSRGVASTYKPPTCQDVANRLLKFNYKQCLKKNEMLLLKDAVVYDLALYGDGAMVKRMPLLNMLASGAHLTTAILKITDCTGHMSAGGKKDASYIAKLFEQHMRTLDPTKKVVVLLYFDGASNVQKAGHILCAKYPRVTCLHGAEHVVSLFFDDISKIPAIKLLINFYKKVYGLFGSGVHHAPHDLMNQSCLHNKGKSIGLIRAADTQMAKHHSLPTFASTEACYQKYCSSSGVHPA